MQNRLFERLGKWAMLDDESLRISLTQLGIEQGLNKQKFKQARTLFARAIEVPGSLKIQTIHSFCSSLLRRFPLEAEVSPNFTEIDEWTTQALCTEILEKISTDEIGSVSLANFSKFVGDVNLIELLTDILKNVEHAVTVDEEHDSPVVSCYEPKAEKVEEVEVEASADASEETTTEDKKEEPASDSKEENK